MQKNIIKKPCTSHYNKEEIDFLSQHKGNITFEITPRLFYAQIVWQTWHICSNESPIETNLITTDCGMQLSNLNDTIGSDHAPHLKINKDKEYPNSPSGMPGVQTLMPVMLNHINDGKLTISQLIIVCENPVRIFGIQNKGFIKRVWCWFRCRYK